MLETAIEAAQAAGVVAERFFEMTGLEREEKDDTSFVTKADTEAEEVVVAIIAKHYPDHGILGEEGAEINPGAEYQWLIDPIDGTGNFINGIPLFAISIALLKNGVPVVGVVYNPVTRSLYAAEAGKGATYNGKKVAVSSDTADKGLITLGPGPGETKRARNIVHATEGFFKSVRLLGCTALELGYVARGGTEAFICLGLKPWDYAAGQLLVREAGGTITDYEGNECDIKQNYFVASNGITHDSAVKLAQTV